MRNGKLADFWAMRAKERAKPITWHLLMLRRKLKSGSKEANLIAKARRLLMDYEVRLGLRKSRRRVNTESATGNTIH